MTETPTLTVGTRYIGTVTGNLNGTRTYREVEFTAARTAVEPFIRDRETTPDQDRVFVVHEFGHGHAPRLYVTDSIRPAHTGQHYQGCVSCYTHNDQFADPDRSDAEHARGLRNAAFIAAARDAVPALIAELREARAVIEQVREWAREIAGDAPVTSDFRNLLSILATYDQKEN